MTNMGRPVTLLDCTVRDGSYAIDFKFTAADTALIAGLLDGAGLRYIEIGHGLGLGAARAGKGQSGSDDLEVIRRTREVVSTGKIGAFFIPGIGTEDDLRDAAGAGLDFIRIGYDADEIETALPFLTLARELGLAPFLNFMKTYGITPSQFAQAACRAADLGAAGVYVVDSAGGMLPSEVAAYVEATRAATDVAVGFHGHSNLHLAVANSIAAYDAGASFVDTSVYGIGRSSGNVPTEVMSAVFDRLGVECGVNTMEIVDIAEEYLRPLADHLHPHTMTAVSMGYGRFHSAFLPRALRAAEESSVNPFKLIVALGRKDMMRMSDNLLDETVEGLRGSERPGVRNDIARFSDDRFGPRRIATRPEALAELLDGLEIVAAKRHLSVVLDLVPSTALDEEAVTSEFVLEDGSMALGRLRFGSAQAAATALQGLGSRVLVALLDGADQATASALTRVLPNGVVPYSSDELELEYLGDAALTRAAAENASSVCIVDPRTYPKHLVDALAERISRSWPVERVTGSVPERAGEVIIVAGAAGSVTGPGVQRAIHIGARGSLDSEITTPETPILVLLKNDAYRDTLPRWQRALASIPRPALARGVQL